MAGHRKRRDPSQRWLEHAAKAVTPDDQLAVAYDRFRALIARLRKRQRDPLERASNTARADRLATAAAGYLHELSDQAEKGDGQ